MRSYLADKAISDVAVAVKAFCASEAQDRYEKQRLLDRLLGVLLKAERIDAAESLAASIHFRSLQLRYLGERQWNLGRKRQYQMTISRLRSFAIREQDPCGNYHGPMSELEAVAEMQRAINDRAGYAVTLEEAERFAIKANESPAWIRTAVYGMLAAIQYHGGDAVAFARSLKTAHSAAQEQTTQTPENSLINTVWLSVSDAEIKTNNLDPALLSAKRMPNRESRANQMAKVFASAGSDSEALALVQQAESPDAAARLCLWIATHIELQG